MKIIVSSQKLLSPSIDECVVFISLHNKYRAHRDDVYYTQILISRK